MRIVSLIPSATEIVSALGFTGDLVGRSHECDYPHGLEGLPVLTEPAFAPEKTSVLIDRQVKDLLSRALSLYKVDAERLRELRPDVIVTQAQCEVCAVSLKEVERAVADWLPGATRLVSLVPNSLQDVWEDFQRVADALGVEAKGRETIAALRARLSALSGRARQSATRPRVACVEWIEPLMAAGNWIPELVEMVGGVDRFGVAGRHSPWIEPARLWEEDPEVIILMPCGFDMPRTRQELSPLTSRPEWAKLRAVRAGRVFLTDGNQYFNRPGPRLVESAEILAELIHPDLFPARHRDTGWQPL